MLKLTVVVVAAAAAAEDGDGVGRDGDDDALIVLLYELRYIHQTINSSFERAVHWFHVAYARCL